MAMPGYALAFSCTCHPKVKAMAEPSATYSARPCRLGAWAETTDSTGQMSTRRHENNGKNVGKLVKELENLWKNPVKNHET